MEYVTATEVVKKWSISFKQVHTLCAEVCKEGAARLDIARAISKNAEKPADARSRSGKYIKNLQTKNR